MDSIVCSVIEKFKQRSEFGKKKYGTTLDRNDLNILDWIQHSQEELMDGILYLEKLKTFFQNKNISDGNADGLNQFLIKKNQNKYQKLKIRHW